MTIRMNKSGMLIFTLLSLIFSVYSFSQDEITQENMTACKQALIKNCETISFNSGRFSLKGFFIKPDSPGLYPVLVFNHGDSEARIDRTSNGVYWIIWKKFADIGYACLSWDTPGGGESTGTHDWDRLFEERMSIVLSAIEYLKQREDVDPAFIGLLGHSQAGYVMPMVISKCDDIAFMINLSGPAMSSIDQGSFLIKQQLMLQGILEEEAESYKNYYLKRARAKDYSTYYKYAKLLHDQPVIRDEIKWGNITPEEEFKPFSPESQWNYKPYDHLINIRIPVVAIFGENDHFINAIEDAKLYEEALNRAGNKHFTVKVFPDADHSLGQIENGVYRFAPGVFDLAVDWLSELKKTRENR
jgi:pimeloyl-ACP methyl ester carboxylesterase